MQFIGQGAGRWPTATSALRDLCAIRGGTLRMMRDDCTDAAAVNDIEQRFFVRLPALYADLFDAECIETAGETARLFTKPVAVDAMHALVKSIREKGAEVFFASVEEEND